MELRIKGENGCLLTEDNAVKVRWNEYFSELLNEDNGKEAQLTEERVAGVRLEVEITVDDVRRSIKKS